MRKNSTKKKVFSEETMQALMELGEVLKRIARRLIVEGKARVVDGKIVFLERPPELNRRAGSHRKVGAGNEKSAISLQ